MPVLTTASAISRISLSLTSHPNLFQLFHPIGGVAATVADCASAVRGDVVLTNRASDVSKRNRVPACKQDLRTVVSFTITTSVLDAQIIQCERRRTTLILGSENKPEPVIPRAVFARGARFFFAYSQQASA